MNSAEYMLVAAKASAIGGLMASCQRLMSGDPLSGLCYCPTKLMAAYKVSMAEITYIMAQKQPQTWATPRKYCGAASRNCPEPKCIPLPR